MHRLIKSILPATAAIALLLFAALWSAAGCSMYEEPEQAQIEKEVVADLGSEQTPISPKRVNVSLVDITVSLKANEVDRNRSLSVRVFRGAVRPGDAWTTATISNDSFSPAQTYFDQIFPPAPVCPTPVPPEPANPFLATATPDDRPETCEATFRTKFEAVIDTAAAELEGGRWEPVQGTDIVGALFKAGLLFEAAPTAATCNLIIYSDMADTAGLILPVKLQGVNVVVVLSENNPALFTRAREDWSQFLVRAGAADVHFVHAGVRAETIVSLLR
ncbi:MAG: hypothetical protein WBD55_13530 [Dehalococcoidia bacterium]